MTTDKPNVPEAQDETIKERIEALGIDLNKLPVAASYEDLERALPEVAAMKGFDQRSDFHSLTLDDHTKELVRHMEENPFIQNHPKRDLILLAGKLHDLGKTSPEGQQVHKKDPEKRQYVGHEKESEKMVREILAKRFELAEEDLEFVAKLTGLHASALNLVNNFQTESEPKGKALKAYDEFMKKVEEIPGDMDLESKMRIVFAFNRADKMSGYNEKSDINDEKVKDIIAKSKAQVETLDEMVKALPALIAAIIGRRSGDQTAGISKTESGEYVYKKTRD